jgi:hypothetical protein
MGSEDELPLAPEVPKKQHVEWKNWTPEYDAGCLPTFRFGLGGFGRVAAELGV